MMGREWVGLQSSMLTDAELLASYLADRDVACAGCGYNLKGCVADQCPECGGAIVLGVVRHPWQRRFIRVFRVVIAIIAASMLVWLARAGWFLLNTTAWNPRGLRAKRYLLVHAALFSWCASGVFGVPSNGGRVQMGLESSDRFACFLWLLRPISDLASCIS